MPTHEEMLQHFGILGMKWGKKKGKKKKTTIKKKPKVETKTEDKESSISKDYILKESLKNKKITELSNEELRKFNERIQLEKQYAQLTKKEMSEGKKFVVDLLKNIAKEQATNFAKSQVTKMLARRGIGG
jgi:RecG-like helicase